MKWRWEPVVSITGRTAYTSYYPVWIVNHTQGGVLKLIACATLDAATEYHKLTVL